MQQRIGEIILYARSSVPESFFHRLRINVSKAHHTTDLGMAVGAAKSQLDHNELKRNKVLSAAIEINKHHKEKGIRAERSRRRRSASGRRTAQWTSSGTSQSASTSATSAWPRRRPRRSDASPTAWISRRSSRVGRRRSGGAAARLTGCRTELAAPVGGQARRHAVQHVRARALYSYRYSCTDASILGCRCSCRPGGASDATAS